MANVYFGSDVEDFIFDESATYEEACSKKEGADDTDTDPEVSDDEMNECGVIECVDDPEVACYRIALENEQNYNMIMNAFMLQEFSILESTGEEMVYEAADVKKFFGNIKAMVQKFWGKVQGVFKNVMTKIGDFCNANKQFVKKYKGKTISIPKTDKEFKGYNFTKNTAGFKEISDIAASAAPAGIIHSYTDEQADKFVKAFNEKWEKTKGEMRAAACGKSGEVSGDAFNKELKISFFGSEDKVKITLPAFTTIIDELEKAEAAKKLAKESYKSANDSVKNLIKQIKTAEGNLKKEDGKNAGLRVGKCLTQAINASISIMSVALSAQIKAINARLSQNRSLGFYYVSHQPKAKNESAVEDDLGIVLI